MGTRLYVGGINDQVKREDLEELFGKYGKCEHVWVASNPPVAFVNFETEDSANKAAESLNGSSFKGCKLRVEISTRQQGGSGGRGDGFGVGRGGDSESGGHRGHRRGFIDGEDYSGGESGGHRGYRRGFIDGEDYSGGDDGGGGEGHK